ncbi:hypothetical protein GCM10010320_66700 [Streptomyces caelestis]|nr:hypothetical protein GCM10010320_66700 [Streptomyces caelestis]
MQLAGNHLESFDSGVALGDFDVDTEAGAEVDGLGAIAGAGPCLGRAGAGGGARGEQVDAAGVVGDAGRSYPDGRQQPGGVDTEVALAACDAESCTACPYVWRLSAPPDEAVPICPCTPEDRSPSHH